MDLIDKDWMVYAIIAIGAVILVLINIYIVVLWQHPDDKNEAYWPKILVITGLTLAEGTVLFLPLDVANNGNDVNCSGSAEIFCGSIDMSTAWTVLFYLIFIYAFFLIPFSIFFYEFFSIFKCFFIEEDDTEVLSGRFDFKKTFLAAAKYMIAVCIMVGIIVGVSYYFLGYSSIPVVEFSMDVDNLDFDEMISNDTSGVTDTTYSTSNYTVTSDNSTDVELKVDFGLYLLAIMSFIGWILFAIFAGIGIPSIGIDCIRAYTTRPQKLDSRQIKSMEGFLARRCRELIEIGTLLKTSAPEPSRFFGSALLNRKEKNEFKKFKQMVYLVEEDYEQLKLCKQYSTTYNPLVPIFWLIVGIGSGLLGLFWVIHIILYVLVQPAVTPFLNSYFNWFDLWFPLLGALSVSLFCMYLLVAAVKGCFKFGLRLMWFTLHPMKLNGTYMNSFLFNVGVILICVPALIQFCVTAFSGYASNAEINNFVNVQVNYLWFFSYFYRYHIFVYLLLSVILLGTLYFSFKSTDKSADSQRVKEALQRIRNEEVGNQ